jgi:UDP-N-acetylmuramoyl-L-alanyl-D-glutamate--2,6-diaminopimelate ligase
VRGSQRDGHAFLPAAEARGAALAIVEDAEATALPAFVVREGRRAAAVAAAAFHGEPAAQLTLIGVTGTNGKTTTVGMLRHCSTHPTAPPRASGRSACASAPRAPSCRAGRGSPRPGRSSSSASSARSSTAASARCAWRSRRTRSTSGASRACASRRPCSPNLTRDHLDYHGTMEAYLAAKARLVDHVAADGAERW